MGELNIEITEDFQKITCTEGYYITNYRDETNIQAFKASKEIYLPIGVSYSYYRCISEDEYIKLKELKEKTITGNSKFKIPSEFGK